MTFREYLKDNIVYLDGGMGTLLQNKGLNPGECPENWNVTHSDVIIDIHKAYYDAGSNVVCTNTFGANSIKFNENELEKIIKAAIQNAKKAQELTLNKGQKFIALDIGPSGKLLKPLGDLDFEDAVSVFSKTVKLGKKYGADLVMIETMNDSYETKAALLAVKENCDLPVIVSNAYSDDGCLMTGATPETMIAILEGMGADVIGANCSFGPKQLVGVAKRLVDRASVPVSLKPNAGLPKSVDGKTIFDVDSSEFSNDIKAIVEYGVRVVGGCCGTTPEYIKALVEKTTGIKPKAIADKKITTVASYTHTVDFDKKPVLIGERINPTGKKRFKQALRENDIAYVLNEGVNQQEKGVHILDVNVGLPDVDEVELLTRVVCELQGVIDLPLQIDTSNSIAMEKALRYYNGKAMINSVNGKQESMDAVFPLVKKYGGVVVALTLDEDGLPKTVEKRIEIANKILSEAKKYGIDKKDIVFDTLALTISSDTSSALGTLKALNIIRNDIGCHTSLGVSNVSFGLPNRDAINSTFFALALENGLSAAIMNPYSVDMMKTYYTYNALKNLDENCSEYISVADSLVQINKDTLKNASITNTAISTKSLLQNAIVKGFKDEAKTVTNELLKSIEPLDIVQNDIIPALNIVGEGFENKTVYLPQLLMSAEASKSAFECIKDYMTKNNKKPEPKCKFVIATVKGDIHDIGKNIVKLLLSNYGFDVIDLGKDVPPEIIVDKVIEVHSPLCGLSALMTTTVPAMEETIKQLKQKAPWCKCVVGGAVLTQEYADKINADKYAKDAMETVRYAQSVFEG